LFELVLQESEKEMAREKTSKREMDAM